MSELKKKIGDVQKLEKEEKQRAKEEEQRKAEMLKSFKKHGVCLDYKPKCRTMLGVYTCWDTDEHRKYRCPIMDYT